MYAVRKHAKHLFGRLFESKNIRGSWMNQAGLYEGGLAVDGRAHLHTDVDFSDLSYR